MKTNQPNKALHLTATRVTLPAGSLRSLAGSAPRTAVGELGRSAEIKFMTEKDSEAIRSIVGNFGKKMIALESQIHALRASVHHLLKENGKTDQEIHDFLDSAAKQLEHREFLRIGDTRVTEYWP